MSWLIGYTLASLAAAFVIVRIFDYLFSGAAGSLTSVTRASVFVITWAAVTAKSGMHGFSRSARQLRQSNADAESLVDALTGDERRR
tara:strand:+ start:16064 stop:16324 length:261 start_codon:yes stop_codon:yes gene_type:complete